MPVIKKNETAMYYRPEPGKDWEPLEFPTANVGFPVDPSDIDFEKLKKFRATVGNCPITFTFDADECEPQKMVFTFIGPENRTIARKIMESWDGITWTSVETLPNEPETDSDREN